MKKNKKPLLEGTEEEECIGTCFACVPECERRIPEDMESDRKPVKEDCADK